jgi:hypothetical protein
VLNAYPLQLPKLSQELSGVLFKLADSYDLDQGWDPSTFCSKEDYSSWNNYHSKTNTTGCIYKSFDLTEDLQQAIKQEMTDELFPFSKLEFYFQIVAGGDALCPHVDVGRILNIMYNISDDGATTKFYNKLIDDNKRYIFTEHELSPSIETHQFESYQWYIFNNQMTHGVTNVTKKRIAVAASIPYQYKSFYDYYLGTLIVN